MDILKDGTLDLPHEVLERLDLLVCSVHYLFELSAADQTDRILRALDNPFYCILGHPTGRQINRRQPYPLEMPRLLRGLSGLGCAVEVNAQPQRLDLNEVHAQMAKEYGVLVAISADAHSTAELGNMHLGVAQARRGWLEAQNVMNTRPLAEFQALIAQKRRVRI